MNWSIDKDRKHTEYFLSRTSSARVEQRSLLPSVYYFVWYSQLLSPKYLPVRVAKRLFGKKVVAVATNDIRLYEETFQRLISIVDVWVSPSNRVSAFFAGHSVAHVQIPFYVSPREFYRVSSDKRALAEQLGVDAERLAGKVVVGSFQRDSLGDDLTQPKWQKDPDVIVDICRKLPREKLLLLLAGPRRHYLVNKCRAHGIPFLFVGDSQYLDAGRDDIHVNNLPEDKMNLLYNLADVYIVSSKNEGGPKAIAEASLAKTFIVSTDVGLAPDFLHPDLIYSPDKTDAVAHLVMRAANDPGSVSDYVRHNYEAASGVMDEGNYGDRFRVLLEML